MIYYNVYLKWQHGRGWVVQHIKRSEDKHKIKFNVPQLPVSRLQCLDHNVPTSWNTFTITTVNSTQQPSCSYFLKLNATYYSLSSCFDGHIYQTQDCGWPFHFCEEYFNDIMPSKKSYSNQNRHLLWAIYHYSYSIQREYN